MPDTSAKTRLPELDPPFVVSRPETPVGPLVLCSPHSGRIYPKAFLSQSRLDPQTLRKSEDCFVDDLFSGAQALGLPMIAARFPRAFLDVNREPYEFDPELFQDPLPDFANTSSVRVVGGLGTIARIVADGEEIYRDRLLVAEALERVDALYLPFHAALKALIDETRERFGYAILIDCHSMPSAPSHQTSPRPEFVIGDRFGISCDPKLSRALREKLQDFGFDVTMNRPYAGGYITEYYGRPHKRQHAVQLEINRGLYLDEARFRPTRGFEPLKQHLTKLMMWLIEEVPAMFERRAAAE